MKKILPIFVLLALLAPVAQAATITSEKWNSFYHNDTHALFPIAITATANDEIGPENGLNLLFDANFAQMLWDAAPILMATGTAVDNGKIAATITPEYKNDYRILHIPVLGAFSAGQSVTLSGVGMRAYRNSFSKIYLQLDTNGDLVADATDLAIIEVLAATPATDRTPPYPPKSFDAILSPDLKSVTLRWVPSPDFDLMGMNVDRIRNRNGNIQDLNLVDRAALNEYVDFDIQVGDILTYRLMGNDGFNVGEPLERIIEVKAVVPPPSNPPASPAPPLPVVTPPSDKSEQDQLAQLYGYYKVRQAIKCRIGVPASDSACLWAKIDVVYAQKLLGRSDVNIALSARDLYLMGLRIVWPEKRYQTECVEATIPDKSCPALEKSIKRVHYFID